MFSVPPVEAMDRDDESAEMTLVDVLRLIDKLSDAVTAAGLKFWALETVLNRHAPNLLAEYAQELSRLKAEALEKRALQAFAEIHAGDYRKQ